MTSIPAPSDRRFRRALVKPGRSRRGWRAVVPGLARIAVLVLIAGAAGWRATMVAVDAHVLEVDRIVVRGNARISRGEILAVLTGLRGESLIWTDLDAWRRRLLASPWVREAALRRALPSTVEVVIAERVPMAVARLNGILFLVDAEGAVIDQLGPQYADLDLPIVDGLGVPGGAPGAIDEARAALAARVIAALRADPAIARRLSQVDAADLHDAAVILDGDPAVIQLGEARFLPRLQQYLELSAAVRARVPAIDRVDLRFDGRIYVSPAGRPARGQEARDAGGAARRPEGGR
ncbi:MAG: FtsQ-type POTRA domain-containing protein [Acidobacteria bacterium]|nr:FtsQ-type POTRA domain-containing protein [Acidobacteriota bacterium]